MNRTTFYIRMITRLCAGLLGRLHLCTSGSSQGKERLRVLGAWTG